MFNVFIGRVIKFFAGRLIAKHGPEWFIKGVEKLNDYEYVYDDDGSGAFVRNDEISDDEDMGENHMSELAVYALQEEYEIKKIREQEYVRMKRQSYVYEDDDAEMDSVTVNGVAEPYVDEDDPEMDSVELPATDDIPFENKNNDNNMNTI